MSIPGHLPSLLQNLYAGQEATVRTRHGTTDWFQTGKGVHQAVCCHPGYLTYMQRTSCEILGCVKHKLESRLPGEISITSDVQMTPAESEEELKSLLMRVKEESEKAGLKLSIKKLKFMGSGPITSWQIEGGKVEAVTDFIFLDSKITADRDYRMKLRDVCSLERKLQ